MQDLRFAPFNSTSSLARSPSRPGRNESLLMANRASLALLGQGSEVTTDPKGKVLRQLRLNAGLDPSELATRACISLAQLYEIEMGLTTRFYSTSLREQAAKRVAQILCADWHNLATDHDIHNSNNVVKLQWPSGNKGASVAAPFTSPLSEAQPQRHGRLPHHDSPAPLGLSTPCASTVETAQIESTEKEQPHPSSRWVKVVFWTLLSMLAVAATVHAINEWSPYRVIWPWQTAFASGMSLTLAS